MSQPFPFTTFLKKHYGARVERLSGRLICAPPVYLTQSANGKYERHDERPKGKYLCFFSADAREQFLKMNAN